MDFETNRNSSQPTDSYLCVSTSTITLEDLPLSNRAQCVKCVEETHDSNGGITAEIKCHGLSGFSYTSQSMFAIESYLKDKPDNKENFRDGGVWATPALQPQGSKLDKVEAKVEFNNKGISYKIHTIFQ